jgi:hypothetical protein
MPLPAIPEIPETIRLPLHVGAFIAAFFFVACILLRPWLPV